MRDPGVSLEGAFADVVRQVLKDVLSEMAIGQRLDAIEKRLPPAIADLNHPALEPYSKATLHRMIKDGRLKRIGGKHGGRVMVDLNSLRGPDDEAVARLALEARGGG
jgi:hypothetical protein